MSLSFQVRTDDLASARWVRQPDLGKLSKGQILVSIEKIALTSNNITYARMGDRIPYWRYFPVEPEWGRVPVWGLGRVKESRHPTVGVGEPIYGFFPMDAEVVLQPGATTGARVVDLSPHRSDLPPTYNEYVLIDRDKTYDRDHADAHLALRPLFSLSFFCAAFLKEKDYFGGKCVILTSASSKAAQGMALMFGRSRQSREQLKIIGLTSSANVGFLATGGLYDEVHAYSDIAQIPDLATVLVDIGGDARHRADIHRRLANDLKYSVLAGFTHWDALGDSDATLPGPKPEFFFTPDHILRLRTEWGMPLLRDRLDESWRAFLAFVDPWLRYEHTTTQTGVERVYRDVLAGTVPASKAHLLTIPVEGFVS